VWPAAVQPGTMSGADDTPLSRAPAGTAAPTGAAAPVARDKEWKRSKIVVGVYANAVVLILALLGSDNIDPEQLARLEHKTIRRLGRGQIDKNGKDVSGYLVVSDAGEALLFTDSGTARKWANNHNQVNTSRAPSLTYIDSGHSMVRLL